MEQDGRSWTLVIQLKSHYLFKVGLKLGHLTNQEIFCVLIRETKYDYRVIVDYMNIHNGSLSQESAVSFIVDILIPEKAKS